MKKKSILSLAIITALSSNVIAEEIQTQDSDGIRFSVPAGPFYDPLIGGGLAVIPTAIYNTTEGAAPSKTSAMFMYSTSQSWVAELATENYFGSNSEWFVDGAINYSYAEIDFTNFMQPIIGGGATSELQQTSLTIDMTVAYKIFDKTYFGPFVEYKSFQQERFESNPLASSNMLPDAEELNFGATLTFDDRNHKFNTTKGLYVSLNGKKVEREDTGGNTFIHPATQQEVINLNGEKSYFSAKADIRGYYPLSDKTTFAARSRSVWNGDEASDTAATLYAVANGFTHESGGRSAVGIDLELRHWFNDKWGMIGGVSAGKPFSTGLRDDDARYAVLTGLRYMLLPEDGLSARLDVAYNSQDSDEFIGYFNVGQTF